MKLRLVGLAAVGVMAASALVGCAEVPSAEVGDCIDSGDLTHEEIHEITTVSCDTPHDMEVFHKADLPESDFPGDEEVIDMSTQACDDAFEAYVGTLYEESALGLFLITPLEETWNSAGDREVICLLEGEVTTSSYKGSGL